MRLVFELGGDEMDARPSQVGMSWVSAPGDFAAVRFQGIEELLEARFDLRGQPRGVGFEEDAGNLTEGEVGAGQSEQLVRAVLQNELGA